MTSEEIRQAFLDVLGEIAPEGDYARIKPDLPLRDQLDIDSYDFLNVVVGLHERLGVEVPEADYQKLATLDSAVRYLAQRLGAAAAG
jgi:acyl carrier protein